MARQITPTEPVKILLVEDAKGDAILITKTLEQTLPGAVQVQHVGTLELALKAIAHDPFEIVLLDRSLPDVVEFSGLLSLQNMAPKLPIIFLTSYRDENVALDAIGHGAQDYLFKDHMDGPMIKRAIEFAMQRKEFESTLIHQANFDMLTGIANRALFESRVDMALARIERGLRGIAVFFIDLDGFKQVNDLHGHSVGDGLLKEVAARLKKCIRAYDVAARFGGDEFAVLIEGVDEMKDCETIAAKILAIMQEPVVINNISFTVGLSLGIATCFQVTTGREEIMHQADLAMYESKQSKTNKIFFFNQILKNAV